MAEPEHDSIWEALKYAFREGWAWAKPMVYWECALGAALIVGALLGRLVFW